MVKQATAAAATETRTTDLEPIDRLEEKIKRLVDAISELRAEQQRSTVEREQLIQEITALRSKLADADVTTGELAALRHERDIVRSRVAEMLQQLEAI